MRVYFGDTLSLVSTETLSVVVLASAVRERKPTVKVEIPPWEAGACNCESETIRSSRYAHPWVCQYKIY